MNYAKIRAPFRGTIVSRKVDPGSFVQNASTGHPTPVLSIARTDIVTVVMRVPDNYAPFVGENTQAVVELDALPGLQFHGRVTRFSPSLMTAAHDRTMRVEVDLWNRTPEEHKQAIANPAFTEDLKDGPFPILPQVTGTDPLHRPRALLPGMYGRMTLVLKTFENTYLIPSQAIIRQGGRSYLYVVEEDKAHLTPVQVQLDDGTLAKVERLGPNGDVVGSLTGREQIIISNQEELTEASRCSQYPATPDHDRRSPARRQPCAS